MKSTPSAASKLLALTTPLVALSFTPAHGAFDAFLKIEGVDGEATDERHRDQIEIYSWSWGASSQQFTGGGGGKVSISEITISKEVDKSSPKLFLGTAKEQPLGEIVLRMTDSREGSDEVPVFYEIVLQDAYITSIESGARTREELFTENITLNFSEVKFSYANRDDSGRFIDLDRDEDPVQATIRNPDRD